MHTRAYVLGAGVACFGCGTDRDDSQTTISGGQVSITAADDDAGTGDDAGVDDGDDPGGGSDGGVDDGPDDGVDDGDDSGGGADSGGDASSGDDGPAGGTVDATDFPSIQDAIDSLEGIGGAVFIPAGEHLVPEKLRVHSNITVFGAGMDQTIIRFEPGAEKDHMISNDSGSGYENIVIRDMTLQGNGPDDGINDCCYGLKLENVVDSYVIGVASRDHGRDGFYLGYKHVDGVATGVYGTRVSGCVASGNGRNGLSIVQGENNVVDGCTFENNNTNEAVAAVDLEPEPYEDGLVRANRILNNLVQDNGNNGIQMWAEGGAIVAQNAICFNTITGNAGTGIADHQADENVFVGNDLSGNGADADYDGSAKVGDEYEDECGLPLPDLPALPPLPP
jgi:parallel beta-helix repeat protein